MCQICSKLTIEAPDIPDIILVSIMLTLNIFDFQIMFAFVLFFVVVVVVFFS